MTDNEKRAHDLAVACLPNIMKECHWEYYLYDKNDLGYVNPDIIHTYDELYKTFLDNFNKTF